jgi:hypothetical protein
MNNNNNNEQNDKLIDKFWNEDIYLAHPDYIYNEKISNILITINKLKKRTSSHTMFSIGNNLELEVFDSKNIHKEINKIKKENISYLKTHVECIPEYFKFVQNINLNSIPKTSEQKIIYLNSLNTLKDNFESESNSIDNLDLLEKLYQDYKLNLEFEDVNKNKNENENKNEKILLKLKYNFEQIHGLIKEVIQKNKIFNKDIILLDGENILKSFKIQYVIKNIIGQTNYNKYFDQWIYGDFNELVQTECSMSLSEYSNSIKYTEPFNSIGLNLEEKKYLIDLILSKYFLNSFVIYFLNSKMDNNPFTTNSPILTDNTLFYPILYNKLDIREQDDHLLIFLYKYLSQYTSAYIVSGDKFKFYKDNITIRNFNIFYDLDKNESEIINLILCNQKSNDIVKYLSNLYDMENWFPIIELEFFKKPLVTSDSDSIDLNNLFKKITNKFIDYIKLVNEENKLSNDFMKSIIIYINQTIKIIIQLNNKFKQVYNFLYENSKKDIFKTIFENTNIFKPDYLNNFENLIEKFKIIINLYLIFKSFKYFYSHFDYTNRLSKLFTLIIDNYDVIDIHIYKIRKLSNKNTAFNYIFLHLNSIYLYIKKIGLCKKN